MFNSYKGVACRKTESCKTSNIFIPEVHTNILDITIMHRKKTEFLEMCDCANIARDSTM
jgi:hypothetical protein